MNKLWHKYNFVDQNLEIKSDKWLIKLVWLNRTVTFRLSNPVLNEAIKNCKIQLNVQTSYSIRPFESSKMVCSSPAFLDFKWILCHIEQNRIILSMSPGGGMEGHPRPPKLICLLLLLLCEKLKILWRRTWIIHIIQMPYYLTTHKRI